MQLASQLVKQIDYPHFDEKERVYLELSGIDTEWSASNHVDQPKITVSEVVNVLVEDCNSFSDALLTILESLWQVGKSDYEYDCYYRVLALDPSRSKHMHSNMLRAWDQAVLGEVELKLT